MSTSRLIVLTGLAALASCGGSEETSTTTSTTSTTTHTGTTGTTGTTETGTTTTTTPVTGSALKAHIGWAITDVVNVGKVTEWSGISYDGTESERYEDDKGNIICEVSYLLNETAENTSCDVCWWAFDLEVSDATITAESGDGCGAVLGVDKSTVGDLFNGTTKSYGYNGDYYGHATVLFTFEEDEWDSVAFGYYVDKSGEFSYQREFGPIEY